jgi:hypothetical protein
MIHGLGRILDLQMLTVRPFLIWSMDFTFSTTPMILDWMKQGAFLKECALKTSRRGFFVTGHFKTSQPGSNQNRPL